MVEKQCSDVVRSINQEKRRNVERNILETYEAFV
jgi:DNA-binding cell septation regulator SpoVG